MVLGWDELTSATARGHVSSQSFILLDGPSHLQTHNWPLSPMKADKPKWFLVNCPIFCIMLPPWWPFVEIPFAWHEYTMGNIFKCLLFQGRDMRHLISKCTRTIHCRYLLLSYSETYNSWWQNWSLKQYELNMSKLSYKLSLFSVTTIAWVQLTDIIEFNYFKYVQ